MGIGIFIIVLCLKKEVLIPFFVLFLNFAKPYIYSSMEIPLYFYNFGGKFYLKFDTEENFNNLNWLWVIGFLSIASIRHLCYYIMKHFNNDKFALAILCPKTSKISFITFKEIIMLLLTLGSSLMSFISKDFHLYNSPIVRLLYIFVVLTTFSIGAYIIKPYKVSSFNKIFFISLLFSKGFVIFALIESANVFESRQQLDAFLKAITIVWLCYITVTLASVFLYHIKKRKSHNNTKKELVPLIEDIGSLNKVY
jgi:hypothetical protein